MGRTVVTARTKPTGAKKRGAPDQSNAGGGNLTDYSDALLRLIPVEVIGLYLSMSALAVSPTGGSESGEQFIQPVIFVIGALLTYFYLKVYIKVPTNLQVMVSVGAFCVWALAINSSGPDPWISGRWTGILVLVYTFVAPKIPIKAKPAD